MNRTRCGACGEAELVKFLDLGHTPLANTYPDQLFVETRYPLGLTRCAVCNTVQSTEVIPDHLIYGEDYGFYSGGSAPQRQYHERVFRELRQRYPKVKRVVEIACNDGSLLQHFRDGGYDAIGVDPAAPARLAVERGLNVAIEPFTHEYAQRLVFASGHADLVIANNSMAHIEDLADVFAGIGELLVEDTGRAVIEVQYLPDLLAGNMFDQVYHEHRYFHSLRSFQLVAALHDLQVVDAELIELQNGGIRITLARGTRFLAPTSRVHTILRAERWLVENSAAFDSFQGRVDRVRDHLLSILADFGDGGDVIGGYAAAAKATTILNYCGLGPEQIPFVVDATPQKQGKYVPGTGIPIVPPEKMRHADAMLLLSPNYLGVVLRAHSGWFADGGRWIVPLPVPVVIG